MSTEKKLTLKDFEANLKAEKANLEKNMRLLKAEVSSIESGKDIGDIEDMAELEINNTTDQAILFQLQSQITEIDAALNRINMGVYGICEKTGKSIPIERLMANPTARTIVGE
ncbi:TraR/DksA family transcriptional regulator [Sulfuricurvum sp.]|uniref:TraR/DksA family transcriptional regulator n=1 Tax=Sulfuricurvum sp. TaxID=2025608 RepID=UPI00261CC58B|nr:TraR/DksA family transcriptional regulator [Sulfuricurvum sp.]MDD2266654.1 TraR/DksA family transcriptional regulator [Sulfuricurvum sp.]MDD2785113.1 TraR/DksA family transcriptional regulator [Sulfuricurvum sp.]